MPHTQPDMTTTTVPTTIPGEFECQSDAIVTVNPTTANEGSFNWSASSGEPISM